jgi:hypothetical protein
MLNRMVSWTILDMINGWVVDEFVFSLRFPLRVLLFILINVCTWFRKL